MNVVDFLFEGHAPPSAVALIDRRGTVGYGELRAAVAQFAAHLRRLAVQPGDRCVILSENSIFWVESYLGSIKSGCTAVPIPANAGAAECAAIVRATTPRVAFVQAGLARRHAEALGEIPAVVVDEPVPAGSATWEQAVVRSEILGAAAPQQAASFSDFDDRSFLAALMFTSGSTATPRGVMVTHRNIIANTTSILEYLGLAPDDRMMDVLPLCYCFGTSLLHTHLRAGGSLVMDNRFMFPDRVLRNVQETACTGFAGVPATYQLLLRKSSFKQLHFPALRHVQQAGGKLPEPFLDELREQLPEVQIFVMYGQTEATARLSYLPPEVHAVRRGSIGRGIPGVRLSVLGAEGMPVGVGEVGEIVAEGENITAGYWNAHEETARVFRGGKLYTGDLATVDADGYVYIAGRSREFLKLGGYRVSCQQIEDVIARFPGVVEAAVVPVPDDLQGESVALLVAHPSGEAIREDLQAFCVQQFPVHQRPKKIVIRSSLARNSAGKLDRLKLREECERL